MTSLKLHHVSLEYNDAARNTFSPEDNIAVYFYILRVMIIVLANLFLSIYLWLWNAMTDWSYSFINFFFVNIKK